MRIDAADFRRVLGHWATGVAIVATRSAAGDPVGLTANALSSLSLNPPLVLICVDKTSDSHEHFRVTRAFSVNMLPVSAERVARRFAGDDAASKFEGVDWEERVTGAPVLSDALAWIDCRIVGEHEGGDHTIFVGEVAAGDAREGAPLLFYRGGYGRLGV